MREKVEMRRESGENKEEEEGGEDLEEGQTEEGNNQICNVICVYD